ncbi:hypothetical protein [Nocardia callitridis]
MAARPVPQPPFTPEFLADLHADNVAPEHRDELWAAVRQDPDALRFLNSLDDVSARLRGLGKDERPLHTMPDDVTARLEQFLETLDPADVYTEEDPGDRAVPLLGERRAVSESGPPPTVSPSIEAPGTRPDAGAPPPISLDARRRARWQWLAAAAAAVVIVAGTGVTLATLRGNDQSEPTAKPTASVTQLEGDDLGSMAILSALGRNEVSGTLAAPAARERCVQANGLQRTVLGSSDIRFRGESAVLILLSGPQTPQITALVVGRGCSADDPQHLAIQDIG